jgi:dGTPase
LYSPEFRRLAEVTQVVGSHENELFHNRLTHTLEVAQVARRLAERLIVEEPELKSEIDPDVVETAALAHDIGHPPFGHIAEERLDQLATGARTIPGARMPVPAGFEGNAQSFRIVTSLARRSEKHHGLDLTRASLQALSKYPWPRSVAGYHHRKYGTYDVDESYFDWTREGIAASRRDEQTAEAFIMDWADDVTYALHDLDDFFRVGLIPLDRLTRSETEQSRFLERTFERLDEQGKPYGKEDYERTADLLFAELPLEPWVTATARGQMSNLVPSKINSYMTGLTRAENGQLQENPYMRREINLLKSLAWTYVIESPALAAQQHGQRTIIETLFDYYCDQAARSPHALPSWAQSYRSDEQRMAEHESPEAAYVRLASDIVASLSERQAFAIYSRVTGQTSGTVLGSILR